jgi:hypothetical protein
MLTLADGTFFPLVVGAIPLGRANGPAGLAPEALQERGCSCKVFSQDLPVCGVLVSAGISNIPASLGGATRTYFALSTFGAPQEVAVHRTPEPEPIRGDQGELSDLFCSLPRRLSVGRRVRFP